MYSIVYYSVGSMNIYKCRVTQIHSHQLLKDGHHDSTHFFQCHSIKNFKIYAHISSIWRPEIVPILKRAARPIKTGKNVGYVTVQLYSLLISVVAFCIPYEPSFVRFCKLSCYCLKCVIDKLLNGWYFISYSNNSFWNSNIYLKLISIKIHDDKL